MKILFYRYGSICEVDVLECFKQSGHEVTEIDDEIYNKAIKAEERVKRISEALNTDPADCVFTINFYPSISDVCNIYHIRYICWIVDSPVLELFAKPVSNKWNRIFVFDRAQYEDIHEYNPECIYHYPLAVNVAGKQAAIRKASNNTLKKFTHDISFVGSLYTEKCPYDELKGESEYLKGYLDAIMEAQLKVYGYYFIPELLDDKMISEFASCIKNYVIFPEGSYLTDRITVAQYYIGNKITALERVRMLDAILPYHDVDIYTGSDTSRFGTNLINHGFAKTLTEMPLIFNRSKINLNPTSKSIRSGIPLRVFDIMACGGFMLSNYQTELCELFVPGEDFVYYDSIEQIPEIADYYLNHEKERREIAHNAFVKVKDNYDYMLRLNKLLLTAFER